MSILDSIRTNVHLKGLLSKHKRSNHRKAFLSLDKADRIGIVADFREPTAKQVSLDFYKRIYRDKAQFNIVLFIEEKRAEVNLFDYEKLFNKASVWVICSDDFNFLKIPKKSVFAPFAREEFDIIFRLSTQTISNIDFVTLSTRSQMYAGMQSETLPFIDFGIEVKEGDLSGLSTHIIGYLSKLNKSKKPTHTENSSSSQHKRLF